MSGTPLSSRMEMALVPINQREAPSVSRQNTKEYQLIQYIPTISADIPPVLPPSLAPLPSEKRAEQDREREEKRKKQVEVNKAKKKSVCLDYSRGRH